MDGIQSEQAVIISNPKNNPSCNLPVMDYIAKIQRRDFKAKMTLEWMANYEQFSTVAIIAMLLEVSQSSARRALEKLVKAKLMLVEDHFINGYGIKIYGISNQGLVAVEAESDAPYFEKGKVTSNYIMHKLETQRIRIIAERLGAYFVSERKIRIAQRGLKKIPDGIITIFLNDLRAPGTRIALELEREPKTLKRLNIIHENYLHSMEIDGQVDCVLYLYPKKFLKGAIKLHKALTQPDCPKRNNLEAIRPYRYMFGALETFPQGIQFIDGEAVNFTAQNVPDIFE